MSKELLTCDQINEILDAIPLNKAIHKEVAVSIRNNILLTLRENLKTVKIYPEIFQKFKEEIVHVYHKSLVPAGEAIGILTAQSIGERQTQTTLNSLEWSEKILLTDNGICKVESIGKIVDTLLENAIPEKIENILENRTEYLETKDKNIFIPSVDENGYTSWRKIEAVTRHLPVGKLVKIKTESGREVTATQSKSFLVWNGVKFVAKNGSDIVIGDIIPTTTSIQRFLENEFLDMDQFFPKNEYLYTTELNKAKILKEQKKAWWGKHNGIDFILPYSRPDSVFCNNKKIKQEDGYIYLHRCTQIVSHVPDKIPLTRDFGFLIGIFLAEGCCTETFTCISNNCPFVRKSIEEWCNKYQITYHIVIKEINRCVENGNIIKGKSSDLKIHSVLITRLLTKICYKEGFKRGGANTYKGHGSASKKVPDFSFLANKDFQEGILDGYFSGDGCIQEDGSINSSSASKELLDGINFLLIYIGVFGKMGGCQTTKNNIGSKNIRYSHYIRISNIHAQNFANSITLTTPDKNKKLKEIVLKKIKKTFMGNSQKEFPANRNVYFDKIVSIDFVESSISTVYDFTVEQTLNFTLFNCICMRDTFHFSGLNVKAVSVGVPRFSELLSATKNPKIINCLIYLDEDTSDLSIDQIRNKINHQFTEITLKRLTKSSKIIKNERLEDWQHFFCDLNGIDKSVLGWRIRFYLDVEILYEYKISMKKISEEIKKKYDDAIVLYTAIWDGIIDVFIPYIDESVNIKRIDESDEELESKYEEPIMEEGLYCDNEYDEKIIDEPKIILVEEKDDNELRDDVMPDDILMIEYTEDRILPNLLNVKIAGISSIKEIYFEKRENEWIITTEGSNLYDLFSNPLVNKYKTLCNNMWEIYNIFGIEATRQFLIEEYMDVVCSDGTWVNTCHVELLVDIMCNTGSIISISRYGQKKLDIGPLSKSSFEESVDQFLKSGVNGLLENTKSVSANIMLGKISKTGTGIIDLIADIPMLTKHFNKDTGVADKIVCKKPKFTSSSFFSSS